MLINNYADFRKIYEIILGFKLAMPAKDKRSEREEIQLYSLRD